MNLHQSEELKYHQYGCVYLGVAPYLFYHLSPANMVMTCIVFIIVLAFIKFYPMFIHTYT